MLMTMPIRPSAFIICFEKQQQPKTVLEGRVRVPTVRSRLQMIKADYSNVSCRNRWMILMINSKEVDKLGEKFLFPKGLRRASASVARLGAKAEALK